MAIGEMAKNDFENVFLSLEGQNFSVKRNGKNIAELKGIYRQNKIQFPAETKIQVGDEIYSEMQNKVYFVKEITFEVAGGVRVCVDAHI